jgi:two-component system sensor histidine kinase KdpD
MTSPSDISRRGGTWRDPLARARERPLSPLLLTSGLVAGSTLVIALVTPTVPTDASGVFYLVAVLAASSLYGLWWGLGASVASAVAFNFFFLPPRHTLNVSASSDWLALAAFAATAVVTSELASRLGEERERRIREQLAAGTLARSNELATALLRAVTHDLRSPLTAITTAAGGLGYADLDAEERELLETIADQSASMSRMIDDLLDLSRLRAGVLVPATDWTDVRDVVETCIDALPPAGRERVALRAEAGLPLVAADDAHLERVVANLVGNALKFSPPGAQVEVGVAATADGGVQVTVADRGAGIDPADAARLREPFQRGPQGGAAGSGLGLAIADGLARANGWSMGLTPRPDGGTLASVVLPATGGGAD